MIFESKIGGIYVLIKNKNKYDYYYGENSWWLVDDWENRIDKDYFILIEECKIEYLDLKESIVWAFENFGLEYIGRKLPQLLINFDEKKLYNNFYDQALEDRVPANWEGIFIENSFDFLEKIPVECRYWNVGDTDYVMLIKNSQ